MGPVVILGLADRPIGAAVAVLLHDDMTGVFFLRFRHCQGQVETRPQIALCLLNVILQLLPALEDEFHVIRGH